MKPKIPTLILLVILALSGHACTTSTTSQTQAPPTINPVTSSPSPSPSTNLESPQPTDPTGLPTTGIEATPTQVPKFFLEEWQGDTNAWKWFSTHGNDNLWDVYNEAGVLVFYLTGEEIYSYFIYRPWDYERVQVTTQIENRSPTKNTTSIVCNYSETIGWYEFNIGTNGLWEVRAHDTLGRTGYVSLLSGGSKTIKTGEAINEFSATCLGNHLTLTINGTQVLDFTDNYMKYTKGKVGLGVISFDELPILIESTWVKISEP
jgi:hypothetical protein